jgi:hypothetical protein
MPTNGQRVACKFNRVHRLLLLPMAWLGRRLAQREQRVLQLMQGKPGFPNWPGPVRVDGQVWPNAIAHGWIEGQTFRPWLRVDDQFFPRLEGMIAALHAHGIAYVDMSKWENILVGDDGLPYLLDYQVHVRLPRWGPLGWLLRRIQKADLYYLHRHWLRARPDQFSPGERDRWTRASMLIRLVERLGAPWRALRKSVLRLFGVHGDPRRLVYNENYNIGVKPPDVREAA